MRLLLVEDNQPLAEAICLGLKGLGHTVDAVNTGLPEAVRLTIRAVRDNYSYLLKK